MCSPYSSLQFDTWAIVKLLVGIYRLYSANIKPQNYNFHNACWLFKKGFDNIFCKLADIIFKYHFHSVWFVTSIHNMSYVFNWMCHLQLKFPFWPNRLSLTILQEFYYTLLPQFHNLQVFRYNCHRVWLVLRVNCKLKPLNLCEDLTIFFSINNNKAPLILISLNVPILLLPHRLPWFFWLIKTCYLIWQ